MDANDRTGQILPGEMFWATVLPRSTTLELLRKSSAGRFCRFAAPTHALRNIQGVLPL